MQFWTSGATPAFRATITESGKTAQLSVTQENRNHIRSVEQFSEASIAEAIIYLALAALLWFVLVRVVIAYRRARGKLPIDLQRLLNLRKWWHMADWPEIQACITEARICLPDQKIKSIFTGISFPPDTIEISFKYHANGAQYNGKFSVGFVDMDWASMATRNAVGQPVRVQFDPKDPKDCVPVEDEWQGFKVWSVG